MHAKMEHFQQRRNAIWIIIATVVASDSLAFGVRYN